MLNVDEINRLNQENEAYKQSEQEAQEIIAELKAYKDVNEDFKTAWEELKAENERLKEKIKTIKTSRKIWEAEALKQGCIKVVEVDKYKQTLKEIKEIIENNCWDYTDVTVLAVKDKILQKITKAEEE